MSRENVDLLVQGIQSWCLVPGACCLVPVVGRPAAFESP